MKNAATPCECPAAGYCERHRLVKAPRMLELCRTDQRYFDLWQRMATETPAGVAARQSKRFPMRGPGTELKRLLDERGYSPAKGCGCNNKIAAMNRWGAKGCRKRVDEIVGWLIDSAKESGGVAGWAVKVPGLKALAEHEVRKMVLEAIERYEVSAR